MEGDNSRRQYDQSGYQAGRGYAATPRSTSGSSDRYRTPTHLASTRSPTSVPGTSAGTQSQAIAGYPYPAQGQQQYASPLQDSSLQYQAGDFPQDTQRSQQFSSYSSNMMYSLPSQVSQQAPGYESVQQYQPRQSASIDVLPNQFGVPQYYNTPDSTAVSSSSVPQSYASASYQQQVPYQPSGQTSRSTTSNPTYPAGTSEYAQLNMQSALEQRDQPQDPGSTDDAYTDYLEKLKQTFQDSQDGRLIEAGQGLLELSEWLSSHASDFGLTKDDQELHGQRIKLWNDFNTCWLAVLQRQKDITQEMIDSGQPPPAPQNILQENFLERMGRELVRMCDALERHGLVDYQMGVWEEEIMSVLLDCLHLLEGDDEPGGSTNLPTTLPPITTTSR